MTPLEQEILQALVNLDTAVRALRTGGPKADLRPLLERVDVLTERLPRDSDPNLLHYLHKKSYEKARLFLEGRDELNARGGCHRD
ncbi:MAG TPA: hypothetical protein VKY92_23885 [Verrucomicrobiae bacterium]|jgi:hypothetical protein|nr:hypothetical protein [Verrucomicrobiae bacterium]